MKYTITSIIVLSAFISIFNSCSKEADMNGAAMSDGLSAGKGGSLSKFTIVGNYLYTVDAHYLSTYDISNPLSPVKTGTSAINFDIETIYPFKNRLFIGTRTGLYIYSIDTPAKPSRLSEARHARSCDPVVADDSVAYVTLKSGSNCGPATAGLYVNDVKDIFNPQLKKTIAITDPEGLGLSDSTLYICCNTYGLRIYNVSNRYNPIEKKVINDGNVYKDVIPYGNLLICYISSGLLLYDISDPLNPVVIKLIAN